MVNVEHTSLLITTTICKFSISYAFVFKISLEEWLTCVDFFFLFNYMTPKHSGEAKVIQKGYNWRGALHIILKVKRLVIY